MWTDGNWNILLQAVILAGVSPRSLLLKARRLGSLLRAKVKLVLANSLDSLRVESVMRDSYILRMYTRIYSIAGKEREIDFLGNAV